MSPQLFKGPECWSGRDLNLQPPAQQSSALQTELTGGGWAASFYICLLLVEVITHNRQTQRFNWFARSCDFFGTANCTDFHWAKRMGFIPQLLNCSKSVVQSFDFKGELLKKNKSLVSEETKQWTTGSQNK